MKILNLYAGIGGNRYLWPSKHKVTAVEHNPAIAEVYAKNCPKDKVVVGDAHEYLIKHAHEFDFVWSSPPCTTHSRMMTMLKNKKYPSMHLYEEIIFLKHFRKGKPWLVENVVPYYETLINPSHTIDRHNYWANFALPYMPYKEMAVGTQAHGLKVPGVEGEYIRAKCKWLGLPMPVAKGERIRQLIDNCIHPKVGLAILEAAL